MKKLVLILACFVMFPAAIFADGTFTDYPSSISALAYDGEYFWIGQGYNVLKWDKNSGILAEYTPKDGLPGSAIREIYISPDKKTVWAATDSSVARCDGSYWHTFTTSGGSPYTSLGKAAIQQDGTFWILTGDGKGVYRYNRSVWTHFTTNEGLASDIVYTIAIDTEGVIWVGTDKGVSAYDGTTWKTYTTSDGLQDNVVNRILVDNNNVKWFGIGGEVGGVARFDGTTWTAYNMANGMVEAKGISDMTLSPDNTLYVSLCDRRGLDYGDPGFPPVLYKTAPHVQKVGNPHYYYYTYLYKFNKEGITLLNKHVSDSSGYDYSVFFSPLITDATRKIICDFRYSL